MVEPTALPLPRATGRPGTPGMVAASTNTSVAAGPVTAVSAAVMPQKPPSDSAMPRAAAHNPLLIFPAVSVMFSGLRRVPGKARGVQCSAVQWACISGARQPPHP